ncbi:AAA family ATPase [Nonomuraea salmonea]|uniref:AAA family ATPase n=1 Tax=Nonomuraea salmonea TaxID=46181 RepID=A0ABV5NXI3_9ACTN
MARHDREESLEEQLAWLDAIKETEEAPVSVSAPAAPVDEPVASPYPKDPWSLVPQQHETPPQPLFRAAVDSAYGGPAATDERPASDSGEWPARFTADEPRASAAPSVDDPFLAPLKPLPRPDDTDTYALPFTPAEPAGKAEESTWPPASDWPGPDDTVRVEPPQDKPAAEDESAREPAKETKDSGATDTRPRTEPPAQADDTEEPAQKRAEEPEEQPAARDDRPNWPPDVSETLPRTERPQWDAAETPAPETEDERRSAPETDIPQWAKEGSQWSREQSEGLPHWDRREDEQPAATEPPDRPTSWVDPPEKAPSWGKAAQADETPAAWTQDPAAKDEAPSWDQKDKTPGWGQDPKDKPSGWGRDQTEEAPRWDQEDAPQWGREQPEERPQWVRDQPEDRPQWTEQPEERPQWAEQPEWRPAERDIPPVRPPRRPAPVPVFTAPPRPPATGKPTAESLDPESLLRGRRNAPSKGWRRIVYKASGGWIKPGEPPEVRRRRELVTRARTPVTAGHHRVAVLSLKGGVGKTTTTVGLGATLAQVRGDRVIAVDANPDRGTLSDKLELETSATVRDLLNERDQVKRYVDIRAFTSQAPSRLEVLASDRDPSVSEAFSGADYQAVSQVLENFYSICITDCGTGLLHSAMGGVLGLADQIVLVSSPSVDGARAASATLDWLEAHHYGDLVKNATVVLCSVRPRSKSAVDIKKLEAHFAARCRAVIRVPYDPHLEEGAEIDLDRLQEPTRDAYLQLAASVGDGFAGIRD